MLMRPLAILAVCLGLAAPALAAHPVIGNWRTQPDDNGHFGLVDVEARGALIRGTLVHPYDGSGKEITSPTVGRRIVWGMRPVGGGTYGDGQIWSPDRDKTYASRMTLSGSNLKVSGYVLGLCRGQAWTRAE